MPVGEELVEAGDPCQSLFPSPPDALCHLADLYTGLGRAVAGPGHPAQAPWGEADRAVAGVGDAVGAGHTGSMVIEAGVVPQVPLLLR